MRSVRYLPAGPGRLLCFEKFAKPTSPDKVTLPGKALSTVSICGAEYF